MPEPLELRPTLARLEELLAFSADWPAVQREQLEAIRREEAALQTEAWRRLLRGLHGHPESAALLEELARDEVIYAVLRRFGLLRPALDERIEEALRPVRPLLHAHGGDVEIVEIQPPDTVLVRLTGSCEGCPASAVTLAAGVVRAIRSACPEIRQVRDVSAGVMRSDDPIQSPFAPLD